MNSSSGIQMVRLSKLRMISKRTRRFLARREGRTMIPGTHTTRFSPPRRVEPSRFVAVTKRRKIACADSAPQARGQFPNQRRCFFQVCALIRRSTNTELRKATTCGKIRLSFVSQRTAVSRGPAPKQPSPTLWVVVPTSWSKRRRFPSDAKAMSSAHEFHILRHH